MTFPEFCWYTVVSKPCTHRTTYYPFGPRSTQQQDLKWTEVILQKQNYAPKGCR